MKVWRGFRQASLIVIKFGKEARRQITKNVPVAAITRRGLLENANTEFFGSPHPPSAAQKRVEKGGSRPDTFLIHPGASSPERLNVTKGKKWESICGKMRGGLESHAHAKRRGGN